MGQDVHFMYLYLVFRVLLAPMIWLASCNWVQGVANATRITVFAQQQVPAWQRHHRWKRAPTLCTKRHHGKQPVRLMKFGHFSFAVTKHAGFFGRILGCTFLIFLWSGAPSDDSIVLRRAGSWFHRKQPSSVPGLLFCPPVPVPVDNAYVRGGGGGGFV